MKRSELVLSALLWTSFVPMVEAKATQVDFSFEKPAVDTQTLSREDHALWRCAVDFTLRGEGLQIGIGVFNLNGPGGMECRQVRLGSEKPVNPVPREVILHNLDELLAFEESLGETYDPGLTVRIPLAVKLSSAPLAFRVAVGRLVIHSVSRQIGFVKSLSGLLGQYKVYQQGGAAGLGAGWLSGAHSDDQTIKVLFAMQLLTGFGFSLGASTLSLEFAPQEVPGS